MSWCLETKAVNTASQALASALPAHSRALHGYSGSAEDILRRVPHLAGQSLIPGPSFGWQIGSSG